ncbi:MAG: hypothetical protein ACFBSE_21310 [Prochloraceae cyanobacterium]
MSNAQKWYIVKEENSKCKIVAASEALAFASKKSWGPFASRSEAIAARVGLIRAGKCEPF